MPHQPHVAANSAIDALEAGAVELDAAGPVSGRARYRKPERASRCPVAANARASSGLVSTASRSGGVAHAVLTALDAAGLGLDRDAAVVAIGGQRGCEAQVFVARVVAHVDHDAVEAAGVGGAAHEGGGLGVVEVEGDGDGGGGGGGEGEDVGGVDEGGDGGEGPGEEEEHGRGGEGGGGGEGGEGAFEVVLRAGG